MNRYIITTFALLYIFALTSICYAQNIIVHVSGVAAVSVANPKQASITDAKKIAVGKVGIKFASASQLKQMENLLIEQLDSLATLSKITKTEKFNGKLISYCDVSVNVDKIQKIISDENSRLQNINRANRKDKTAFFVRVIDNEDIKDHIDITFATNKEFAQAFDRLGFIVNENTSDPTLMLYVENVNQDCNYNQYKRNLEEALAKNVKVSFAVIGEIKVINVKPLDKDYYVEVECDMELVKVNRDNTISVIGSVGNQRYNNIYISKREAVHNAVLVGAINCSKYLAEITYNYWQSKANQVS